jgi:hypothetical protein
MNSRKVISVLLAALLLTASGAALTINIDLFDFGGDGEQTNQSNSSQDTQDDQKFTYGGSDSDQITDDKVEKSMMEEVVGAVVNTLFG